MCVCVCTLTYNVGGHKHPRQRGALEESQQQENNGAVGQTHGHPQQTGQAGGHQEAVSTSQPGNTHHLIQSPHTRRTQIQKLSALSRTVAHVIFKKFSCFKEREVMINPKSVMFLRYSTWWNAEVSDGKSALSRVCSLSTTLLLRRPEWHHLKIESKANYPVD